MKDEAILAVEGPLKLFPWLYEVRKMFKEINFRRMCMNEQEKKHT